MKIPEASVSELPISRGKDINSQPKIVITFFYSLVSEVQNRSVERLLKQ